ncbi:MAG: hypothetical protein QOE95_1294, partial [Gaiellaceae bacterium]|nr:hypothetical protein [Gaiellaceae bacterium]
DEAGLAGATLQALRDPALRKRLGAAGRAVYEESFTPERAGTAIVRELERLAQPARIPVPVAS